MNDGAGPSLVWVFCHGFHSQGTTWLRNAKPGRGPVDNRRRQNSDIIETHVPSACYRVMLYAVRLVAATLFVGLGAPIAFGGQTSKATDASMLLTRAVEQYLANQEHWAYTESQRVVGFVGKAKGETIQQVDPSKPYIEQIKPVRIEGGIPTSEQIQEYRNRGEWMAKQRDQDTEKPEGKTDGALLQSRVKINLGGQMAIPDLEHAVVISEDDNSVTFGIPFLTQEGNHSPMFERFAVTVRINKLRGDLEHFAVRQRDSFRVKLIAKIASFEEDAEFTLVDPRYPSVMTRDIQKATVSILFIRRVVTADIQRTNLIHVANYDERFGVKLGPIRTLKF